MKILLHICCAPCSIYPYESLLGEDKFDIVTGFFYNPNIHPYTEYLNRKKALEEYSRRKGLPVVFHKYDIENYFRRISGNEEANKRCQLCWQMRLTETATFAVQNGYDFFTTTLLVSPYQDQDMIKVIAERISKTYKIQFFYKDFRKGFKEAQHKAKDEGIYRQIYCGCIYSERERFEKLKT